MSTYEVLTLLILFGTFLIALLANIDRNNKRKPRASRFAGLLGVRGRARIAQASLSILTLPSRK